MSAWHVLADHAQTWVDAAKPPDGPSHAPPGLGGFGNKVIGWLKWILSAAAIAGVLCGAVLVAVGRRNRNDTAINGFIGAGYAVGALGLGAAATAIVSAIQL